MNQNKLLMSLFALSLWAAGCQKTTVGGEAELDSANEGFAVSCKTDSAYVDPSLLQIEGSSVAQIGTQVTYRLNEDLGCSSSQKVVWKTIANGQELKAGSAIKSSFNSAGEYVIVAQVEGYDPSNAQISQKGSLLQSRALSFKTVVVSDKPVIAGPALAMVGTPISFTLAVPQGLSIASATWDFGDGLPGANSVGPVSHTYGRPGVYTVSVTAIDSNQVQHNLTHKLNVLMIEDGLECVSDLAISGSNQAVASVPVSLSLHIPPCLTSRITAVKWNFGDGATSGNQSVQHTYQAAGNYQITVEIYDGSSTTPWATLTHDMSVSPAPQPTPTPTPEVSPTPEASPSPETSPTPEASPSPSATPNATPEGTPEGSPDPTPSPTPVSTPSPTPQPTPVNPNACLRSGEKRSSQGEIYSETVACGIDGTKTISYRDVTTEECKLVGEALEWVQISKTKQLQNEGACVGQSCQLPDGSKMANGESKTYYSSQTPAGSCSSVSQVRTCNNGVLSGSTSYTHTVCHAGCGDFGSHGTTKNSVITGEVTVPLTCAFGEQGYFSIHHQVSDQVCNDGQIINSNTRQGQVKTPGSCPTYRYVPTDSWTTCSADCGGKQTRIHVCKDNNGADAPAERCAGSAAPVEERLCDGNPEAVRRQEQSVAQEEAHSSQKCPSNQIGVVAQTRDVITTTTYACINHQVQQESKNVTYGAWVVEKYCREYVAHRCSKDSLSTSEALGRFKWMVKCQDQIPLVKEFLENFTDVGVSIKGQKVEIDSKKGKLLYPTFMNRASKPEKVWNAPKSASASCSIPSTVYIAAVCVSSCATPEQQILADEQLKGSGKYVTFIEALTKNYKYVTTLKNNASMNSKSIEKTQVDQWVTELVDTDHEIIVFTMKSGRILKLTPNHPIVTSEGLMKSANEFQVGESLVVLGGELDPIVSMERINYFGKVYNLFVKSSDIKKNIVVTNGYLNGTAFFQNQGADKMNRQLFKDKMIKGVFQK